MTHLVTVNFQLSPQVRRETHDGVGYLIAPVVAVRAGVLNGEWLPAEEIAKSVEAWNNVPLPISHPRENGVPISVNRADLLAACVGTFRNSHLTFDKQGLQGELWLDVAKARMQGGDALVALTRIENGEMLEVSTAYESEVQPTSGTLNGTPYHGIQRTIRPDHLALLTNEKGACSVEHGCGAPRVNEKKESPLPVEKASVKKTLWTNLKAALFRTVDEAITEAEQQESHTSPTQAEPVVNAAAPPPAPPAPLPHTETNCDCPPPEQHVHQEVHMDKKELVSNVLQAQGLAESERAKLDALPEAVLQQLIPIVGIATTTGALPTPEPTPPAPAAPAPVGAAPALNSDAVHLLKQFEQQAAQQRTSLTAHIVANSTFTEAQCQAMGLDLLNQFAANLAPQAANYGGRIFPQMTANADEGVPTPPSILLAPAHPEASH